MLNSIVLLLGLFIVDGKHFNGGTIRWVPGNPYDNSSTVAINIIQTYFWTYPLIKCDINVPISTPGRSTQSSNLTCVVDCSTDGGYSAKPISILTDCTSTAFAPNIMLTQRSVNITLTAGAHFYLAYVGSAWTSLGSPVISNLEWSIVTMIDLRKRPDGLINTSPESNMVSPQYVIVNHTTQIPIPVSDANIGDDIRCRWSIFSSGHRRRRRDPYTEPVGIDRYSTSTIAQSPNEHEPIHIRNKRMHLCSQCAATCTYRCQCNCSVCQGTNCTGLTCSSRAGCTSLSATTLETPGTLQSTSTYPVRQAIDECGGICYPGSVPNGTTLSQCTLSFRGLVPDTWYAVSIQVEDFINGTSTTPMSSVPVQFLIYVMPEPVCSQAPSIMSFAGCLEASVGIPKIFNITVLNTCNNNDTTVTDLLVSRNINGMQAGNLTLSSNNLSLSSMTFTWTPQANQVGSQQMCLIAYTEERIPSNVYCLTFTVISSSTPCATSTTTVTTTTTTESTTSTSATSSTTCTSTTVTTATTTIWNSTSVVVTTVITTIATNTDSPSTTGTPEKRPSWGLIAGILSTALPLALFSVCCTYRLLCSPAATRRHLPATGGENLSENSDLSFPSQRSTRSMLETDPQSRIEVPKKSYQVQRIDTHQNNGSTSEPPGSPVDNESSILTQLFANQRLPRTASSSSVRPMQSDLSRTEQNGPQGVINRSMPYSILVSSFLAQENPGLSSAKEQASDINLTSRHGS